MEACLAFLRLFFESLIRSAYSFNSPIHSGTLTRSLNHWFGRTSLVSMFNICLSISIYIGDRLLSLCGRNFSLQSGKNSGGSNTKRMGFFKYTKANSVSWDGEVWETNDFHLSNTIDFLRPLPIFLGSFRSNCFLRCPKYKTSGPKSWQNKIVCEYCR